MTEAVSEAASPFGWVGTRADGRTAVFTGSRPRDADFAKIDDLATPSAYDAALAAMYDRSALSPIVPETITDRQFFQQLAVQNVISQDEALAAVRTGAIPAAMQTLVDGLPKDKQFGAEMLISGATVFHRTSELTSALAAAKGWASSDVDALWTAAAAL